MPDVMQQVNELKSLPDQSLQFELANPSGAVPAYLVLAEAQRRQLLRTAAQAQQNQAPVGSVYDDVIRSMMARQPQPGQAPAGMTPPPASPPSQPQNMRPPMQMAEGGDVDEDDDGGDGGGDGGVTEMPTKFNLNQAVVETARRHNLDPADLWGVVQTESRGDPNAVGPKTKHGQAIGLMQLLPSTARQYGVDAADLKDPQLNLETGASYLDDLKRNYNGDWDLTRAAYNAGPGNVDKYGGIPPFRETKQYLKRADQFANQFKGAETWRPSFVDPPETRLAPPDLPGPGPDYAGPAAAAAKAMQSLVPPPGGDTSGLASAEPPDVGGPGPSTPDTPDALSNVFPQVGPRPAAPDVAAATLSAPYAAPISVPAATSAAPSEAAANIKELQSRLQKLWDEAESTKHPTVKQALFRMLENFGAGMATTPARNWGGALGAGAAGIAKGFAADQEAARQQELKLLGVSLETDKMVQEHEDAAARIRATAQNQADKAHDEMYAKFPGAVPGIQGQAGPQGYVAEPLILQPGHVMWWPGTMVPVTPDLKQFVPAGPDGTKPTMVPAPVAAEAQKTLLKVQENIATSAGKPKTEGFTQQEARARTTSYLLTHPQYNINPNAADAWEQVMRNPQVPDADKDGINGKKETGGVKLSSGDALIAMSLGYDPSKPLSQEQSKNVLDTKNKVGVDALSGIDPNLIAASDHLQPGQRNEALLQTLSPGERTVIKQLADYKMPMPTSGMALRQPEWQKRIALAGLYDPSFDVSLYGARQKLRTDFMAGKNGTAINALNTATAHLDRLEKNWQALANYGGWATPLNRPANWLAQLKGDPRIQPVLDDQQAVANELMRVWRQTGAGSEKEIEDWKKGLDINASPEAQAASIKEMYGLISGKLAALKNQYETGMGRPTNFHMLTPETQKRFAAHGIDPSDLAPGASYASYEATPGTYPNVTSKADYDKLPKGASYIANGDGSKILVKQ